MNRQPVPAYMDSGYALMAIVAGIFIVLAAVFYNEVHEPKFILWVVVYAMIGADCMSRFEDELAKAKPPEPDDTIY